MAEEDVRIEIPGYRILRQIGRGGMANVYLAIQESMERQVALKIMRPALITADPTLSERFVREARIVAKLSHPNINAVYDVGVAGPHHYISMEYIAGGDLKTRIRSGMTPSIAFGILREVAGALAFAHAKGYVHRDVKPGNVLFRDNGTAVLTDFGIAKANDVAAGMTTTGTIIGTPHYMSPEQAKGQKTDRRSDLYSLGVMLYEMLTGAVPYNGDSAVTIALKHVTEPIPRLPPLLSVYQPLLDKFLAKDPADRFQIGEQAIAAIDAVIAGGQSATRTVLRPVNVERTVVMDRGSVSATRVAQARKPRSRRSLLAGALLLPLLVAGVYLGMDRKKPDAAAERPFAPAEPAAAPAPSSPAASVSVSEPAPAVAAPTEAELRAAEIAQLLAAAAADLRAGRYLEPNGDAAVPKYQRVLELDPGNADATRALRTMAGELIAQAERAMESGAYERADRLLQRAAAVDSSHPLLFSRRLALKELRERRAERLQARIERKIESARDARPAPPPPRQPTATVPPPAVAAQAPQPAVAAAEDPGIRQQRLQERRLNALLSRLQDLLAPGSLTAARVQLAQDLMGEATRLAPDDERVRGLPERVADAYLRLATAQAEDRNYPEAEALVRRGLDLRPNDRRLIALQKDISAKKGQAPPIFGSF